MIIYRKVFIYIPSVLKKLARKYCLQMPQMFAELLKRP